MCQAPLHRATDGLDGHNARRYLRRKGDTFGIATREESRCIDPERRASQRSGRNGGGQRVSNGGGPDRPKRFPPGQEQA
jgi:hypothetical protein